MLKHYTLVKNGEIKNGENAGGLLYTVIYTNQTMNNFYFIDKEGLVNRKLVENKMKEYGYVRHYCYGFDAIIEDDKNNGDFAMVDPSEIKEQIDFLFGDLD